MTPDKPNDEQPDPERPAPVPNGESVLPTSPQFEDFLKLIERDNPELYKKLRNLD